MLEILGTLAAATAAAVGYVKSRAFVRNRLRFVDAVHRPTAPLKAGTLAVIAVAPAVWLLPAIGTGTALVFGAAVGIGVRAGARDIRRRLKRPF